jgi:hypothetical protein
LNFAERYNFIPYILSGIDGEELKKFVPELLDARYPGRSQEAPPAVGDGAFGWVVELDGCIALARAAQVTHPFILIRGGIAHEIPRSEELALHVATANKDLVVGRAYLAYGDDIAMVAFDESIFGAYLSAQYEPSMLDVVNRLETSFQYTSEWSKAIRERFGGRPFTVDDWALMSM